MLKKILYGLLAAAIALGAFVFYITTFLPAIEVDTAFKINSTPQKIAQGKYLANAVAVCIDCHSERDYSKFSGPIVKGTEGQGGEVFNQQMGFPGSYTAKNITPAALKNWSDAELLRAITAGVNKNGDPLFSIMPHHNYGKMALEDITAIMAYIRTLPAIEKTNQPSSSDFPMSIIIHTIPKPAQFQPVPDKANKVAYGKYIFTAASCDDCHTKKIKGQPVEGMTLAGGFSFKFPWGTVSSSNITPHKETGIGTWSEEQFVQRFKAYDSATYTPAPVQKGELNSPMPWTMYAEMTVEDLQALYAYLKTVKPVKNKVETFAANQ